jgi:hypothetical protein
LDSPEDWLVREIAQRAYDELLKEARQLANKEDSAVGRIKLKNAWMLRSTLESLLPNISLEKKQQDSLPGTGDNGQLEKG